MSVPLEEPAEERAGRVRGSAQHLLWDERLGGRPFDPAEALHPSHEATRPVLDVHKAPVFSLCDSARRKTEAALHQGADSLRDFNALCSDREDQTTSRARASVRHVQAEEFREVRVHTGRGPDHRRALVPPCKSGQGAIDPEMASLHDDDPVAGLEDPGLPPPNLAVVVHDRNRMVVGRLDSKPELCLDCIDIRGSVVLGN